MYDFVFNWQSSFETGVKDIDDQHRQLFKIGRDIEQLLIKKCIGVTDRQMLDIILELRDFTNYHYYTEEKMMEECKYPDIQKHKEGHKKEVDYIMNHNLPEIKESPYKEFTNIKENLQRLLFMHIMTEDFKFAKYYMEWKRKQVETKLAKDTKDLELIEGKYGYKVCNLDISTVYLSKNQNRKGHIIVEIKEKKTDIIKLLPFERNGYFEDVTLAAKAVKKIFNADDFDYVCVGDGQSPIHFDIIPKYKKNSDDYSNMYYEDKPVVLSAVGYKELVDRLRKELAN